jgi:predicted dehydrogenase
MQRRCDPCRRLEVLAVMSPTTGHARDFASKHGIAHHFEDLDAMLAMDEIDMVVVGAPNFTHCEITVKAANAGKHVVVEKPLCLNLEDATRMIATCDQAGVKLMLRGRVVLHAQVRPAEAAAR